LWWRLRRRADAFAWRPNVAGPECFIAASHDSHNLLPCILARVLWLSAAGVNGPLLDAPLGLVGFFECLKHRACEVIA